MMSQPLQRALDLVIATLAFFMLSPFIIVLTILGYFDTGSPIFIQKRIGKNKKKFNIIKFRTMRVDTISIGTHLVDRNAITGFGKFLRVTKADELPQLLNVIRGEMSLVGYRPCLPDQYEVIDERCSLSIFDYRPGITGLSQIRKIDMSRPKELAEQDSVMFETLGVINYFKYLLLTALGRGGGDRVTK
jgi:O-antigen biosynthesis protein WbqP